MEERSAGNVPLVSYTRGSDLSGALDGAGGIGGLLARTTYGQELPGAPTTAFYHSDGNGNITALMYPNQQLAAKYLYDSFGNMLAMSGPLMNLNRYRFSSKEWNDNAGLYYYLYRFYDPSLQRWLNRDPSSRLSGQSTYCFVTDNPITYWDNWGLCTYGKVCCPTCEIGVTPYGETPDTQEGQDAFASAAGSVQNFADILDEVGPATAENAEELLTKATESVLKWPEPDAEKFAEQAKGVFNKAVGEFNGYNLFTRIRYKKCDCGGLGHLFQNYWLSDDTTVTEWDQYKVSTDVEVNDGIFVEQAGAYKAAPKACAAAIKAWKTANASNIENP